MAYPKHIFLEDDINNAEIFILKSLNYKLDCYTCFNFIQFFSLNGILFSDDYIHNDHNQMEKLCKLKPSEIQNIYDKCLEIANQIMEEEISIGIPYIFTALSIITLTRNLFKFYQIYPKYFEECYHIKFKDFSTYYDSIKK